MEGNLPAWSLINADIFPSASFSARAPKLAARIAEGRLANITKVDLTFDEESHDAIIGALASSVARGHPQAALKKVKLFGGGWSADEDAYEEGDEEAAGATPLAELLRLPISRDLEELCVERCGPLAMRLVEEYLLAPATPGGEIGRSRLRKLELHAPPIMWFRRSNYEPLDSDMTLPTRSRVT